MILKNNQNSDNCKNTETELLSDWEGKEDFCIIALRFRDELLFVISYTIEESGQERFVSIYPHQIASFNIGKALMEYVRESHIVLYPSCSDFDDPERIEYDFIRPALMADGSVDCKLALNRWNLFSDAAHTVNEPFLGDERKERATDLYVKLFAGNNLPVLRGDNDLYIPNWTPSELMLLAVILDDGGRVLGDALSLELPMPTEQHALRKALREMFFRSREDSNERATVVPEDCIFRATAIRMAKRSWFVVLIESKQRQGSRVALDAEGRVLAFSDYDCLFGYANEQGWSLDEALAEIDCDGVSALPDSPDSCHRILGLWDAACSISNSTDALFYGALDDKTLESYHGQIKRGAGGGPQAYPSYLWTAADIAILGEVIENGMRQVGASLRVPENELLSCVSCFAAKRDVVLRQMLGGGQAWPCAVVEQVRAHHLQSAAQAMCLGIREGSSSAVACRPSEGDPSQSYCYPCQISDCGVDAICLWRHGETSFDDHFMTDGAGRILSFKAGAEAKRHAVSMGLEYKDENAHLECLPAVVSLDGITDCRRALDRWNTFGDAAHSVGDAFIGDEQNSFMNELYSKVFAGSNLPVMIGDHEPYVPDWRPGELVIIALVLDEGRAILREGLGLEQVPALEISHFEESFDDAWRQAVDAEPLDDIEANFHNVRLVKVSIGEEQRFALTDDKADLFLVDEGGRILSFFDEKAATSYAAACGMEVGDGITWLELVPDRQLPGVGASSAGLAAAWEIMSGVAYTLDVPFVGDFEDGIIDACLEDLRAEGEGEAHTWTVADLLMVYYVQNKGWEIVAKALGFSEEVFAEALSASKRVQRSSVNEVLQEDA